MSGTTKAGNQDDKPWRLPPNIRKNLRVARLAGFVDDFQLELDAKAASSLVPAPWKQAADKCLAAARVALEERDPDPDSGARLCAAAYRMMLQGLGDDEIKLRAGVLRKEAGEKLGSWRKAAVEELLPAPVAGASPVTAPQLSLAQYIVDQHYSNVYFKLSLSARRYTLTGFVLATLAAVLLATAWWLQTPSSTDLLHNVQLMGLVLLLGAVGATLSYSLSVLSASGRIPEILGMGWLLFVRPVLGAVSAVVVVLVLQSGLLPIKQPDESTIWAYAVAAGFTDRLLSRVMAAVEDSAKK